MTRKEWQSALVSLLWIVMSIAVFTFLLLWAMGCSDIDMRAFDAGVWPYHVQHVEVDGVVVVVDE